MRNLLLSLFASVLFMGLSAQTVVINEVNADNPGGADTREYVELFGNAGDSLTNLTIVLFDGATGLSVYAQDLSGYALNNQGFFVAGNANATGVTLVWPNATMQNGEDAVALYSGPFAVGAQATSANLVDAVVYKTGADAATNLITLLGLDVTVPGYVTWDETAQTTGTDLTLSRIPDGGAAFGALVLQNLTPNTWNLPPCTAGVLSYTNALTDSTVCNNLVGVVDVAVSGNTGSSAFVMTDANGIISAFGSSIDFTGAAPGNYHFYHIGYTGVLTANVGDAITSVSATLCNATSNAVNLTITACAGCAGGTIARNGVNSGAVVQLNNDSDYFTWTYSSTSQTASYAYVMVDANNAVVSLVDDAFDFNAIPAGDYTVYGLSYEGTLNVTLGDTITSVSASICSEWSTNSINITAMVVPVIFINELNADNPGTGGGGGGQDTAEFIELYGTPNQTLNGLTLVFFNGATNGTSYAAYDLDGYSTDNLGFFVIGASTVPNVDYAFTTATNVIQNGADAIGLYLGNASDFPTGTTAISSNLLDALVYGTGDLQDNNLIALLGLDVTTPGYFQQDETVQTTGTDLTISRIPDGGAAFDTLYVTQSLTPGTWNMPPCSAGTLLFADSSSTVSVCDNVVGLVNLTAFNGSGNQALVVTDNNGNIVEVSSGSSLDMTGWSVGTYVLHYVGYTNTLDAASAAVGQPLANLTSDQCLAVSAGVTVEITVCSGCVGGTIAGNNNGTVFNVIAGGNPDVLNLTTSSTSLTATYLFLLTDTAGNYIQTIDAAFDFNTLATGSYLVYGLSYEGFLSLPSVGGDISNTVASICSEWSSNSIAVQVLQVANVVINELNADNPGGPDTAEFIELYGDTNASLNNLVVVLYDGATGLSYSAIDLAGYMTDNNGFFVLGNAGTANVDLIIPNATIQNGADAVAIYVGAAADFPNGTAPTPNNMIEAMVYGTGDPAATNLITGLTLDVMFPGYTQFDETAQQTGVDLTQSRVPDGGTAMDNSNVVLQQLTPGTYNIVILGCTDSTACNYNPEATVNDGTCILVGDFCDDGLLNTLNDVITDACVCAGTIVPTGCMVFTACNYNALAQVDDGSCVYPGDPCDDGDSTTTPDLIDANCLCNGQVLTILGCTDSTACNFNAVANTDDGSCILIGAACDDNDPSTINDVINDLCSCVGTPGILGCMDASACNYNGLASIDDGSCLYVGTVCDDGDSTTVNDLVGADCICSGTPILIEENQVNIKWNVYPNPTQANLIWEVEAQQAHTVQVRIVDVVGNLVLTNKVAISSGVQRIALPTESLQAGFYTLQWILDGNAFQRSFVKE